MEYVLAAENTDSTAVDSTRTDGLPAAEQGLVQPDEPKIKLVLAAHLNARIKALELKQSELASLLGIAQPNVSALLNNRLANFSAEKLLEFFNVLGYDVDLLIRPATWPPRGTIQVLLAD
jgi:predicted XRE-type DNA-binding protein